MLAPQCGLMHNVTSAMSLQVQCKVTLLQYFKYIVTKYSMCVCTSVTKSELLYMMCSWQIKVILILTLMTLGKHVDTGTWLT